MSIDKEKLPRWQSHKIVYAAKIVSFKASIVIELADGSHGEVPVEPNMFARYSPVAGDYYVIYDDGYASISPRKAFEEGYHRLP